MTSRMFPLVLLLCFLLVPYIQAACNCSVPTLTTSFQKSSVVIKATVLSRAGSADNNRLYNGVVQFVYKGCQVKPQQSIVLTTKSSAADCGVFLDLKREYLLMGQVDRIVQVPTKKGGTKDVAYISISKCGFQAKFNNLNAIQRNNLNRLKAILPRCPVKCNAKSCNTTLLPTIPPCPGQTQISDRVKCSYLNTTQKCDYEILPCPTIDCEFSSCGPVPPLAPCPDFNGPFISCDFNPLSGLCFWNITPCQFV